MMTDTADRVAMRLSLGIVGPEYPIENVRSCANDLLGLGLRELICGIEAVLAHAGKDNVGVTCTSTASLVYLEERLAVLRGEGETLNAEEQAGG